METLSCVSPIIVDKLKLCNPPIVPAMDMRALVGKNARRLRLEKGLTQEQFAEISGFSQQYISGLEQGHRNPTVVTLYELAQALGVSHLELLRPLRPGKA